MRKKVVELKESKTIGSIGIPLWTIATGPMNYNYLIATGNVRLADQSYNGRLLFEVRMSQSIVYTLRCRELFCRLKKRLGERYYSYNFYVFVGAGSSRTA